MSTCKRCKYWDQVKVPNLELAIGECRVNPPTGNKWEINSPDVDMVIVTTWPVTYDTDWCGSYEPK
jgi:hypothetical protein